MQRTRILVAYRELLRLIARLPGDQRPKALQDARSTMRQRMAVADPAQQSDHFKELAAKISFLKMVTPRLPGDASSIGAGHWVLRRGELVPGTGQTAGTR